MNASISNLKILMACAVIVLVFPGCEKAEKKEAQPDIQSNKVLARVNGDPVYEHDIVRRIKVAHGIADTSTVDPDQWQRMADASLESEIVDRLLLNAATREGITIDSEGVNHLLNRSRKMLGEEKFQEILKKRNSTDEEFREFMEKRSLIKQYKEKLFAGISIEEEVLKRYYEGHQQSFISPESRVLTYEEAKERIRNILLKSRKQEILNDWAESAKQKARIEYIR